MAAPGEPCYQRPHPWDDPPAGMNMNTSNLPQCPAEFPPQKHGFYPVGAGSPAFDSDAGAD
jgi:hypothetical protein